MRKKKVSLQIKEILWGTDFSKESRACLPYMKHFSEKLNTENHALYVLPRFSDWVYETAFLKDEELLKTIDRTRMKSLKKIENYSKKAGVDFKSEVIEGIASEEMTRYAEINDIDIIFVGRRGVSEIEQLLIGSTTSRLIRNSTIPIFVVPKAKRDVKIDKILSPVDFSDSSLLELKYSISLAKQLAAELHVIHVSEFFNYKVPVFKRDKLINKINEKIAGIAEDSGYQITNIIYEMGEPAQKIMQVAKKLKADLIPMAIHQKSGIERFFLGSISEKVLMYSDIPVLILPPSNYELS
jgi:nucleotide-binding universal stress UspA family protein